MTQEYHVTLKQKFLKGFTGAVMQIIKHFVIGVLFPLWIYTRVKMVAHGQKGYYKGYMIQAEGSPIYNNGTYLKTIRNIRETKLKNPNADVLGRSKLLYLFFYFFLDSAEYYHTMAPWTTMPLEVSIFEKNYHNHLTNRSKYGRGE